MLLYRVKTENGYLHGQCLQTTKDKWLALTSKENAQRNLDLLDGKASIEAVFFKEGKSCKVGSLEFNPDDTYRLSSVDGIIVHETKKYLYTLRLDNYYIEKHKKNDINTRDFKTGKGVAI